MKKIRAFNTKLIQIKNWEITSKKKSVEIIDEKNGFAFCIRFGKRPKIQVYNNSCEENFGDLVFKKKL